MKNKMTSENVIRLIKEIYFSDMIMKFCYLKSKKIDLCPFPELPKDKTWEEIWE